jgi:phosphonate transport system permease protein
MDPRLFAMLPQALPDFVGTVMYILDHKRRAAAIPGLVGASGIGLGLHDTLRRFDYGHLLH